MIMVEAFIRPEKVELVLNNLSEHGFVAATRLSVLGRGKQKGIKIKSVYYDELPKEMIIMVIEDSDEKQVIDLIIESSKTESEGAYGDGKIFVSPVSSAYTISSGENKL
ncbi:MAG: P-II family nitrogen regulator [Clostridiales bacterium]